MMRKFCCVAICLTISMLAGCGGPVLRAYTRPSYVERVGLVVTEGLPMPFWDALPNANPPYYRVDQFPRRTWNGAFFITRPVSAYPAELSYAWLDRGDAFYNEFLEAARQRVAATGATVELLSPAIFEGNFEGRSLRELVAKPAEDQNLDGVWAFHYSVKRGVSVGGFGQLGPVVGQRVTTTTVYRGLMPELNCIFLDLRNPSRSIAIPPKIRPIGRLVEETDDALQKRASEALAQLVDEALGAEPAVKTAADILADWNHARQ